MRRPQPALVFPEPLRTGERRAWFLLAAMVLGFVLVPFVLAMSKIEEPLVLKTVAPEPTTPTTTTPPPTTTHTTHTTSTTTGTTTTTTTPATTTAATTATTTTTTTTTVGTTTTTGTTASTTHTTTTSTTTPAPPTCQSCSYAAFTGACAVEYSACTANFVNCRLQCSNPFLFDQAIPSTCYNGIIPEWPALQTCLCNGQCEALCPTDCNFTAPTTATPTLSPAACTACYNTNTGPGGACEAERIACDGNPSCSILCAGYYADQLPVYPACASGNITEWTPLFNCLCPLCGSTACTANNSTCP